MPLSVSLRKLFLKAAFIALCLFGTLFFIGGFGQVSGQTTKVLANEVTYTSGNNKDTLIGCGLLNLSPCFNQPTVQNSGNAILPDNTFARLLASPGLALGLGSYQGEIELKFPTIPANTNLPAGTVSYVRINGDSELLDILLGGSLGDLLGSVVSSILLGRQGIEVQVRNSSGTQVLSRTSTQKFDNEDVRLVQDSQGYYYLRIKPDVPYDKIRIINSSISLLGLGSEYTLDVYNAFYYEPDPCDVEPAYTSFDGSGVSLDLLQLNELVVDPNSAIDNNPSTSSEISLGVVGLLSSTEQLVYFNTPVQAGNDILISLGIEGGSLLDLDLFESIEFQLYSSDGLERTVLASDFLSLDLLGLFNSGESYDFPISLNDGDPPITRIGVEISSLVSAGLLDINLKFSDITVSPTPPVFEEVLIGGEYIICKGSSEQVFASSPLNSEMTWFNSQNDSIGSGASYILPNDLDEGLHIYTIQSELTGCNQRSLPTEVKVRVVPLPENNEINLGFQGGNYDAGLDRYIYQQGMEQIEILPGYEDIPGGTFTWYMDEDGDYPLALNPPVEGTFEVDEITGKLTISNTTAAVEEYQLFLGYETPSGCKTIKPITLENFIILPSMVHRFDVQAREGKQVGLVWELSNEQLEGSVQIQRASSNLEFAAIGSLPIATGMEKIRMEFTDQHPLPGRNYYRLFITKGSEGSNFYSEVRMAKIDSFGLPAFVVFPNSFVENFTVESTIDLDVPVVASLLNTNGAVIRQLRMDRLSYGELIEFRDLSNLPEGIYILRMETARGSKAYRVIKQNGG